jgi:transposase
MANRPCDSKEGALAAARALHPHPDAVIETTFSESGFLDPRDLVQVRYEMVRRVRVEGGTVSGAAADFGFSRPSWYAAAAALDRSGLPGLFPARSGPRRAYKLTEEIVAFVIEARGRDRRLPAGDLARRVEESFGVVVHPRSIERALERAPGPKRR